MPDDTLASARRVADALAGKGHVAHAARLHAVLAEAGDGLLAALRETCQTILTAIEAIDPVSATMVDELRMEVDSHLSRHHPPAAS
ncbi:hypothetical protein [Rhodopila sp.]|jgi:hypothetical protein|uniref:hypothetical protein n=1 Tax=Rhodopila sp. TaxID=2480087 RepID=UPI002B58C8F9|nr:hypothetical protein [Rhodopila sp.]HVZ10228.1 hypothetical protein [Rhodopila sp.]